MTGKAKYLQLAVPTSTKPLSIPTDGLENLTIAQVIDSLADQWQEDGRSVEASNLRGLKDRDITINGETITPTVKVCDLPFTATSTRDGGSIDLATLNFDRTHVAGL